MGILKSQQETQAQEVSLRTKKNETLHTDPINGRTAPTGLPSDRAVCLSIFLFVHADSVLHFASLTSLALRFTSAAGLNPKAPSDSAEAPLEELQPDLLPNSFPGSFRIPTGFSAAPLGPLWSPLELCRRVCSHSVNPRENI